MNKYKVGDKVRLWSEHYKSKWGTVQSFHTGYSESPGMLHSFQILDILGEKGDTYTLPEMWVSPYKP